MLRVEHVHVIRHKVLVEAVIHRLGQRDFVGGDSGDVLGVPMRPWPPGTLRSRALDGLDRSSRAVFG